MLGYRAGPDRRLFGRAVRKFTRGMLRDGLVHNVASDAHDVSLRTPSLLAEMQKAGLSAGEIERLGRESGRAIIDGTPVPS